MVLAEEVKVGGAQRMQRPCVDQDIQLLAVEAKPARVTVCDDSHLSPSVEGMLSSPDLADKLFPGRTGWFHWPCWHVWDDIPV